MRRIMLEGGIAQIAIILGSLVILQCKSSAAVLNGFERQKGRGWLAKIAVNRIREDPEPT
jgi:hypothetical protein